MGALVTVTGAAVTGAGVGCFVGAVVVGCFVGCKVGGVVGFDQLPELTATYIADESPVMCVLVLVYETSHFKCDHVLYDPPPVNPPPEKRIKTGEQEEDDGNNKR